MPPPRDGLGCIVLLAALVGCLAIQLGALLLLWSAFVSAVMVVTAARDGRRVSRLAIAALAVAVGGPIVLHVVMPALLRL